MSLWAQPFFTFLDTNNLAIGPQIFIGPPFYANTSGYVDVAGQATVPQGAITAAPGYYVFLQNNYTTPVVLDGSTSIAIDECGLCYRFSGPALRQDAGNLFAEFRRPLYEAAHHQGCEASGRGKALRRDV